MPIYEYRCSACGEKFEKLVRTTSSPLEVRCPNCNADKVDRQVSVFGFSAGSGIGSYASYGGGSGCGTSAGG